MSLLRRLLATNLIVLTASLLAQSTVAKRMARDAHPAFAVATIKLHDPDSNRQGFNARGDRFTIRNQSIASMMQFAYALHPKQIVDAPEWMFTERYDVDGTTDTPGEPSLRQQQEMLQKLLADRCSLHFASQKRELSLYAIQIAPGGPKLSPAADPAAEPDQNANGRSSEITQIYTSVAISDFRMGMQFFVSDRPIVDQTGLTGRYDIRLRYSTDESVAPEPNAPPGLFTAIREQLGLKLVATKAAVDVFLVDRVHRPSPN